MPEAEVAHSNLFRKHNQYVGRSLKMNGLFCGDIYIFYDSLREPITNSFVSEVYVQLVKL